MTAIPSQAASNAAGKIVLNPEQEEAADHLHGPCFVLACPGSGKTRVIVERTIRLVQKGHNPRTILCITFTNKAATEMKERISKRMGGEADAIYISTFHALCATIIRKFGAYIGYKANTTILDDDDQEGLMSQCARQAETDILDRVAQLLGLPTNQPTAARPYGRDLATAATGGLGLLIGPANTVIPDGSVLTDPSGTLVVLSGAVNLGALGRSTGAFVALTTGPAGNLSLGTVLTFQAPPPGVTPQVTLTSPLVGGATQESDEAVHLAVGPRPFVLVTIGPDVASFAVTSVVCVLSDIHVASRVPIDAVSVRLASFPLACVGSSIRLLHRPHAAHMSVCPFAAVLVAVVPAHRADPVELSMRPFSLVLVAVVPAHRADPVELSVRPVSLVSIVVAPRTDAAAVAFAALGFVA
jgi:hypothetical protein